MKVVVISLIVLLPTACLAEIIPLKGTIVSGVAYYDPATTKDEVKVAVPRVRLYSAWGKYGKNDQGEIIYDCYDIWGTDCTSGIPGGSGPIGLFHFHHEDTRKEDPAVSLMHQLELDETERSCGVPGSVKGRFFSQFFTPTRDGQGHSVKTEFHLHPTFKPFQSVDEAAEQVAQVIAVRVYVFRHLKKRPLRKQETVESVRKAVESEVTIILDSLRQSDQDLRKAMERINNHLSRIVVRDGESQINLLEWLPTGEEFWLKPRPSWQQEKDVWMKIRQLQNDRN